MTKAVALEDAKATAQEFFHEMTEWEKWCAELDINSPSEETHELRLARLEAIFNKYLTSKARKHKQSRYEFLDFKTPPEFSRGIFDVEPADGGKVWVYKPIGAMNGRARFLMENEGGTWKLALKEQDPANTGKWKRYLDL
jgi:hypothetical protein